MLTDSGKSFVKAKINEFADFVKTMKLILQFQPGFEV